MVVSVGVEGLWAWVWEEAPEEFWTVPSDLALGSSITAVSLSHSYLRVPSPCVLTD